MHRPFCDQFIRFLLQARKEEDACLPFASLHMDILSVASSIAGILSIAGQSIDGIVKLKQLFSDISFASKTVETFLRDINSLLHVLNDVETLLSQLDTRIYSGAIEVSTASLQIELEDCLKDVFIWLRLAEGLRPPSDLGARVWLKKVWVAINQNSIKGIREDIGRHKQALQINLALIGRSDPSLVCINLQGTSLSIFRSLDLRSSSNMTLLHERIEHIQSVAKSLSSASTEQRKILRRLESFSDTSLMSHRGNANDLVTKCSSVSTSGLIHKSCSSGYHLSKGYLEGSSISSTLRSQSELDPIEFACGKKDIEGCPQCLLRHRRHHEEKDQVS